MDSQTEILSKFIRNVKASQQRLIEGHDDYSLEFLKIRLDSDDLRELDEFKSVVGARPDNFRKNRYRDILPFDYSRVTIDTKPARSDSGDYINASFINGANETVAYIATQGPLKETLADFWQMVYQYEVNLIIMLCDLLESGKPKCEKYWPDAGSKMKFGELRISLVSEVRERDHYAVRTFQMKRKGSSEKERIIFQLQYYGWPDHGTPDEIAPLLEFVNRLRDYQPDTQYSPIIVHCSAGCGRTGTICALDYVRALIKSKRVPADFSVASLVADLRKQRPAMVQSKEQYMLLHCAIASMFEQELAGSSSPLQVNVTELFISSPPLTPAPPVPPENASNQNQKFLPTVPVSVSPSLSSGLSGTSAASDDSGSVEQRSPTRPSSCVGTNRSANCSPATNSAPIRQGSSKREDTSSVTSYETLSTTKSDEATAFDEEYNNQKGTRTSAAWPNNNGETKTNSLQDDSRHSTNRSSIESHSISPVITPAATSGRSSHEVPTSSRDENGIPSFPNKVCERPLGARPPPSSWPDHDVVSSTFQRL